MGRPILDTEQIDIFDMFCHWLVAIRKFDFRGTRYWRLALDDQTQPIANIWWQREWQEWQEGGFAALDGDSLGDISQLKRTTFNQLREQMLHPAEQMPPDQVTQWTQAKINQIWTFARQLREGDRIIAHVLLQHGHSDRPLLFCAQYRAGPLSSNGMGRD